MWRHLPVGVGDGMGWWVQPDGGGLGIWLGRTMMASSVATVQTDVFQNKTKNRLTCQINLLKS